MPLTIQYYRKGDNLKLRMLLGLWAIPLPSIFFKMYLFRETLQGHSEFQSTAENNKDNFQKIREKEEQTKNNAQTIS